MGCLTNSATEEAFQSLPVGLSPLVACPVTSYPERCQLSFPSVSERRNLRGEAPDPESLQPIPFNVPATNPPKQHTSERQTYQPCSLQSMLIRVKDLGLGYRSAEQILFKYCSGSCADSRQNYNVALSFLQQNNRVRGISDPCCNPTHYENVAFLDDTHQWHEMEKLSASACGC